MKLQDDTARLFVRGIHCSTHRLEIALKDACKDIMLEQKVSTLLSNLYLFYRNSSLNPSNLKASSGAQGQKHLMLTHVQSLF